MFSNGYFDLPKHVFFVIWKFGSEMCDNDPYHCFGHGNKQSIKFLQIIFGST